ncbi:MAG: cadherin repeat domain-containing protein [Hydrogenophaga sp.]|uniref:cadherin repeat domain-containing protein n=1 Tax=Hydrogenophaga sp. TaxID=1904254 RepID=UPI002638A152|nr:cadherin repeat domain-containing protein [Hydrogenophaga sp.]MCW5672570.1 cadherin repeat domain-containing protein [Hydrogenophaga sp.]
MYDQADSIPGYKHGQTNAWNIRSIGASYCVAYFEYMLCGVDRNKPPECPPSPITRTAYEVGTSGTCSKRGTPIIGAPIRCSAPSDETDQKVFYSIVGGSGHGLFAIDATTGVITVNTDDRTAINYENENARQFTLIVQAQDDGPGQRTTNVTVTVDILDCNDAPIVQATNRTVDENVASGTPVGAPIPANDEDKDAVTFAISGGDSGPFVIDATTGQIRTTGLVNYEVKNLYNIIVRASDARGGVGEGPVRIEVNDLNDPPTLIDQLREIDDEAVALAPVGTPVTAVDEDIPKQTIAYAMVDASNTFQIDAGNGQIRVRQGATLNAATQSTYTVQVTATDDNIEKRPNTPASTTATVTIQVVLSSQKAPAFEGQPTRAIDENSPVDTAITPAIRFIDPNSRPVLYSLVTIGSPFRIDANTGVLSVQRAELDYETKREYSVVVRATNTVPRSADATVVIQIRDVNDPPVIQSSVFDVLEHSPIGTVAGRLQVTDQDEGDQGKLTFTILSGNIGDAFRIRYYQENGVWVADLEVNQNVLDRETRANYHLTIRVEDQVSNTQGTVDVHLLNVDDPPICPAQMTVSIAENSAVGMPVGAPPDCRDPDGDQIGYRILSGNDLGLFQMDPNGQLKVANSLALDYETTQQVVLTIQAMDPTSLTAQVIMTVNILDVNEPPVFDTTRGSMRTILAGAPSGTEATNPLNNGNAIAFTDPDRINGQPQTLTFSIAPVNDADKNLFTIGSASGIISSITTMPLKWHQAELSVTCRDSGNPSLATTVSITVEIDGTHAPPQCTEPTSFAIEENSASGAYVGALSCTDDEGTLLEYEFEPPTDLFDIELNSGHISVGTAILNFEAGPYVGLGFEGSQFTVNVRVVEAVNGGAGTLVTVTINATDANDPPILPNQNAYAEVGFPNGRAVGPGLLDYTDEDAGQGAKFTLISGGQSAFVLSEAGQLSVANQPASGLPASPETYLLSVRVTDTARDPLSSTGIVKVIVVRSCTSRDGTPRALACASCATHQLLPRPDGNCPDEYKDRKFPLGSDANSSGGDSSSSSSSHAATIVVGVLLGLVVIALVVVLAATMKRNASDRRY